MGFDEGLLEATGFLHNILFRDFAAGDDVTGAMENENFAAADTGGNANATKHSLPFKLARHKL